VVIRWCKFQARSLLANTLFDIFVPRLGLGTAEFGSQVAYAAERLLNWNATLRMQEIIAVVARSKLALLESSASSAPTNA
jgi:hypothetical protein